MKNNITRKTAFKTICSLIILMLLSISNIVFAQAPNVPPGHDTDGEMHLPPTVDPTATGPVWTIVKNTNCDIKVVLWFSIEKEDGTEYGPMYHELDFSSSNPQYVDGQFLGGLFGESNLFKLTKTSLEIRNAGGNHIRFAYPGDNNKKGVGEGPCECFHVDMNPVTMIITISDCL